jgi:Fuc2NAc and GlcNAc transferase
MISAVSGFVLGLAGSWVVIRHGNRLGMMDIPNVRSSHEKATPKGAGIGILAAFLLFSLILEIPFFIWVPALVISAVSFWGADKPMLSASKRLLIHLGCGVFFLFFFLQSIQPGISSCVVWLPAVVFIAGTANFFNFMDGIDGIAGITGFVGFCLVAFYAKISGGSPAYTDLSLVTAFSCLGFLCFNVPKARVFLGDVGSILLGFLFACLVIALSENFVDFLVMAGFMAPFYFDELFTMVVRIKDKVPLTKPHRKHIYQILANEAGMNHFKISLGYGLMQLAIGISAISIQSKGVVFLLGTYLFYGLIFGIFSFFVRRKFCANEN